MKEALQHAGETQERLPVRVELLSASVALPESVQDAALPSPGGISGLGAEAVPTVVFGDAAIQGRHMSEARRAPDVTIRHDTGIGVPGIAVPVVDPFFWNGPNDSQAEGNPPHDETDENCAQYPADCLCIVRHLLCLRRFFRMLTV